MTLLRQFIAKPEGVRVAVLACAAALLYTSFSLGLPSRYNSPDEAANAFFARRVADGQRLAAPAPLNSLTQEPLVHPRSTVVVERKLAPASFLGFPLFIGFLGRMFGHWVLPFVTALGAVLGLSCGYLALRELTSSKVAGLATLMLAFLPAYFYYHTRGFFHNALFFDMLLVTAWAAVKLIKVKKPVYYLLAGLGFGITLALRTSEIFWVMGAAAIWFGLSWRELKLRHLWLIALGAVIGFAPVLFTNLSVYGQLLSVGYRAGLSFGSASLASTTSLLAELVLPFGFMPEIIASTTQRYLWHINWWWTILAGAGLLFTLVRVKYLSPLGRRLLLAGGAACLWLVALYGSWQFNDNPDPAAITLGTSYVRYWLPLYAFGLWPAGELLAWLSVKRWGRAISLALLISFIVLSSLITIFEPQEGLLTVRRNIKHFAVVSQEVQQVTESGSIIVTDSLTDKLLWPERDVLVSDEPVQHLTAIKRLLEAGKRVYRLHPAWGPKDVAYLNNRRLKAEGLAVEPIIFGLEGYSLYRFRLR